MRISSKTSPRGEFPAGLQLAASDGRVQGGLPSDGWTSLIGTRANVLVTGPEEALTAFVRDARPAMREPVRWAANTTLSRSEPGQTLILTDVNALDDAGQQWLMQQLNEPHGAETQVISLTSVPLYALVEANRFDAALYYRLNTIHLKI
jgi:hypothetical protein